MMKAKTSGHSYMLSRLTTIVGLLAYFVRPQRVFMFPLLLFVLITGVLLVLTGGLSYVAPFVYAVF
jgi:hypothetical protein